MNQKELIKEVSTRTEVSQKDIKAIMDVVRDVIIETMPTDQVKVFEGLTLLTTERAAREGRNPATGEALTIAAATVPKCKFGAAFKGAF